ncbi:hypothetical protein FB451DRAFT_1359014 [Mycena latifolia]|nr:hypothetical protein FB451DRAFT_1359014 [Mycena latifolia]
MVSSSLSSGTRGVVLPSIHEMFPEHLVSRTEQVSVPRTHLDRAPSPARKFSFDFLKRAPRGPSMQQSAARGPHAPLVPSCASVSSDGDGADDEDVNEEGNKNLKHVCPRCRKRFNRPSSLRIHVNTHTGATPFRCPYPTCGRGFNVNSNMRRHFRIHPSPAFEPPPPPGAFLHFASRISPPPPLYPTSRGSFGNPADSAWSIFSTAPSPSNRFFSAAPATSPSPASAYASGGAGGGGRRWTQPARIDYCQSDAHSQR